MPTHISKTLPWLALALACTLPLAATEPAEADAVEARRIIQKHPQSVRIVRAQWEYKVEIDINERRMNELGKQGWEMVGFQIDTSARNGSSSSKYIFKRTKVTK